MVGLALIFLGFGIVVVAMLMKSNESEIKGAGVIMIGPIPLIFGSNAKWASVAIILAIVLIILSLLLYGL
jgi:uncharacterized protein (TIGR00304 family)